MGIEAFNYISNLDANWPAGTETKNEGDDHIRGIKYTLKQQFPNLNAAVNATPAELNKLVGLGATTTKLDYTNTSVLGQAENSKALVMGAGGVLDLNSKVLDNAKTVQFNAEYDNGSKSTAFNLTLDNGQKQKVQITGGTFSITLVKPTSVGNWVVKLVDAGKASITSWLGSGGANVYWANGTEPAWSSIGTDLLYIYYDGTNFYCSGNIGFA